MNDALTNAFRTRSLLPAVHHRPAAPTFQNPIAPGADPWVIQHDGWYYWCLSEDMKAIVIHRSRTPIEIGECIARWTAPRTGPYSAEVWAPELHFLDGYWYIYVAVSDGHNDTHRMIVLEASSADLTEAIFTFKAELYTGDDWQTGRNPHWAIDGTVLEVDGSRYLLWSGWADERDEQFLYIATLSNPWTVSSNRVRLCRNDDFLWERIDELHGRGLNEGPQVLQRDGRVFVIYSASASWEMTYKLGLIELTPGGDPMDPNDWRKLPRPVFASTAETWGVGHCSFTRSPDDTEDWIVYHAKRTRLPGWDRVIHAQQFDWDPTGRPDFGSPIAAGVSLPQPTSTANDSELPRESTPLTAPALAM